MTLVQQSALTAARGLNEAPAPPVQLPAKPTPGGRESWKWQLRDKNGRWLQLGSEVSFSHQGSTLTGIVIGSPGPGQAIIRMPNGQTVTVPTAGVTATGNVPAKPGGGGGGAEAPAAEGKNAASPTRDRQAKAIMSKSGPAKAPAAKTPATAARKRKPPTAAQKKKAREKAKESRRKRRASGTSRRSERMPPPGDDRLTKVHRQSQSIEALLRVAAKESGGKDPFGDEKERGGKSKDGGSKDGEDDSDTKSPAEKKKSSEKRKDTRKKLTQAQIDAVGEIMKDVLAAVKKGNYSSAESHLDAAEAVLKNTSAPWLLKRINYLQKGLNGVQTAKAKKSMGASLVAYATAPQPSWTWQLRDRLGQWIEMHSEVRWLDRGKTRSGRVVDSPNPGTAVVVEDATDEKVTVPTSRLLSKLSTGAPVASVVGQSLESKRAAERAVIEPRHPMLDPSEYMPLRMLRMDAIRTFGGRTSEANPTEYALARDRALQALDAAAKRNVQVRVAVKKLTEARRQVAAARAWANPPAWERLELLEEQITAAIGRLDPSAVPKPKKARVSATTRLKAREIAANMPVAALRSVDWASGVLDRTGTAGTLLSAGGQSWKWQLRDRKGQWIDMNARVKWLAGGRSYDGKVVGSPKEGIALVEDDQGRRVQLPANRLTATDAPPTPSLPDGTSKQQKAKLTSPLSAKATQAAQDIKDILDNDIDVEDRAAAAEALVDVARGRLAEKLSAKLQALPAVKALVDKGKAAIDRMDQYLDDHPRVMTLIDKVIVWADEVFTLGTTPGIGSAFNSIGLPNPFVDPPGFLMAAGDLLGNALEVAEQIARLVASGQSWRWQLRDSDGQWIDMGSRVKWLAQGLKHTGILIGSPSPGIATVRDDKDGREHTLTEADLTSLDPNPTRPPEPQVSPTDVQKSGKATLDRIPPEASEARPSAIVTSLAGLDPQDYAAINNGGGSIADPVHTYDYDATKEKTDKKTGKVTPAQPARSLTVRQSDVAAHYRDVIEAALNGTPSPYVKATPQAIADARDWYPRAHQECVRILAETQEAYPGTGITLQQVAGVMAAMSPRQAWDQNIVSTSKVINAYLGNDTMAMDELVNNTEAGLTKNVAIALKILEGEGPEAMTGTKRQSFWNNIMDPDNDYDVTIDGWMASAIWRMGGTYSDGQPVDEKALSWIDQKTTRDKKVVVPGAGYIVMADAVRDVARDLGLKPHEAQAIYWVAVGGGQPGNQMWSNERKGTGPGYNRNGDAAWTKTFHIDKHPFNRWVVGRREDGYPIMSPETPLTRYHYGRFIVTQKSTPRGKVWQVRDPDAITSGHAFGSYQNFKTKKAAQAFMDTQDPTVVRDAWVPPEVPLPTEQDVEAVRLRFGLPVPTMAPSAPAGAPAAAVASAGEDWTMLELDDDGGEWTQPDLYDAVAVADMAQVFRATDGPVMGLASAWEATGPHPTAGQILWCWENPDAWDLIEEDADTEVDREWFVEQVVTRVPEAVEA